MNKLKTTPKRNPASITPTRNTPSRRRTVSGKENNELPIAKVSSGRTVEQLVSEMRITACKSITNFKSSFNGMSNKFKRTTFRNQSIRKARNYEGLEEQVTPVKLYSPFTFVTPSPKSKDHQIRIRTSPRFKFASPSGKFQKDVQDLKKGIKELERVEKSLCLRRLR